MARIYPDGHVKLQINQKGISLIRKNSSLLYFFEELYSQDLFYQVMVTLIYHRTCNTEEFCFLNGISYSTLRRKVRLINQTLSIYNTHITVSNMLTILGSEIDIRNVSKLFLLGVHRQFSRVPGIGNKDATLELTKKIIAYLELDAENIRVEQFAIMVFIINLSRTFKRELELSARQKTILNSFTLPPKPTFLLYWSKLDWQYLYLTIYFSGLVELEVELEPLRPKRLAFVHHQLTDKWLKLFEEYFKKIDVQEQYFVRQKIQQQFIASFFVPIEGNLFNLMGSFDNHLFQQFQPRYTLIFDKFWESYLESIGPLRNKIDKREIRSKSLLLCLYLYPVEEMMMSVPIFLYSDQDLLNNHYVQNRVEWLLRDSYHIQFIQDIKKAQIILSTVPIPYENFDSSKFLLIKVPIRDSDIRAIRALIEKQSRNRLL